MQVRVLILSLFLALGLGVSAQNCIVTGTIKSNIGEGIQQAELFWVQQAKSISVDKSGFFSFKVNLNQTLDLIVFAPGFVSKTIQLTCDRAKINANFKLKRSNNQLQDIVVQDNSNSQSGLIRMNAVEGTAIYAAKRSEVVDLSNTLMNKSQNSARQAFSQVTGMNIWESDGAGIQLGIGGRGLSPNRVSNFNTRQNGYDISADALGYPESYYTPPSFLIDRIELIRGAASLQYGTQFGGFLNFKLQDYTKQAGWNGTITGAVGSFGLHSEDAVIGYSNDRFGIMAAGQFKQTNGYRPNSDLDYGFGYAKARLNINPNWTVSLEHTKMAYLAQQAGGLSDIQFEQNPRSSSRERNFFSVDWNLTALKLEGKGNSWKTEHQLFRLEGHRYAVGFTGRIDRPDFGEERDLLIGDFNNIGYEGKVLFRIPKASNTPHTLIIGQRLYWGNTDRIQGQTPGGSDANFSKSSIERMYSEYFFPNFNYAAFSEFLYHVNDKLDLVPGVRLEYITTNSEGYYNSVVQNLAGDIIFEQQTEDDRNSARIFPLFGLGFSYQYSPSIKFQGNISQNYRSINFNDMRVVNPNFRVDPNLEDETGITTDLGVLIQKKHWNAEINAFGIHYDNRIGAILQKDTITKQVYRYRTNIAQSRAIGVESMVEYIYPISDQSEIRPFMNVSLLNAIYLASEEAGIDGNKVEYAPTVIAKAGITGTFSNLKYSVLGHYTSLQYTEATNAETSPGSVNGEIQSYLIFDALATYQIKQFTIGASLNNIFDRNYFTRRAEGYPGPGIIPSDGRNFGVNVSYSF